MSFWPSQSAADTNSLAEGVPDATDTNPDSPVGDLGTLKLEHLWELRLQAQAEQAQARDRYERINQELERRALALRPDYSPESPGSAELAGEIVVIRLNYDTTYNWDTGVLAQLRIEEVVTPTEWDELVKWTATVNKARANQLEKRGGRAAEILRAARSLKSSRATFTAKARS